MINSLIYNIRTTDKTAAALNALQRVAPDVVAVPPPGAKRGSFAAAAPPAVDGGSGVPRAPREAAPAPETPPLETFTFTSNGDNGGFIYWLGTSGQREKFVNPMDRGRVRVDVAGVGPVNTLAATRASRACAFGELALLDDRQPRTATVTALADSTLWALERDTFRRVLGDA